ncbi:MAG: aminoacyl-tRNA hydrolase [Candidatus Binataceae bacterium]
MSRLSNLFDKFRHTRSSAEGAAAEQRGGIQWVIVGLGNPGEQYRRSRHNIGFMTIERLASRNGVELSRRKFNAHCGEFHTEAGTALLVVPLTYYNRSGESAASILGYFKVPAERLIVVHDEMDLPEGQLRVKRGGGDAGNRGVRSMVQSLGKPDFIRVRVGTSHPVAEGDIDYVLKPLTNAELRAFEPMLDRAGDAVLAVMRDGVERAMNAYNQRA